jgi:hypothetical protein
LCNSGILVAHINNNRGYISYLKRRELLHSTTGPRAYFSLVVGMLILVGSYIWSTCYYLDESMILGDFVPAKNRLAMVLVHSGSISLLLPVALTLLVTEARVFISAFLQRVGRNE